MNLNRHILVNVGEMAFGYGWPTPMAGALGVSRRTISRWVAETRPVPAHVIARLPDIVRAKAAERREAAANLEAYANEVVVTLAT